VLINPKVPASEIFPRKGSSLIENRANQVQRVRGLKNPDESLSTFPLGGGSADTATLAGCRTGRALAGAPTWPIWPGAACYVQRGNP
jgi:hypothetical protein